MSIYTDISTKFVENFNISTCDEKHIRRYVSLLALPVELRIVNSPQGTISGYFTDSEQLVAECEGQSGGLGVEAVYTTLNPVNPDLLARANNRVKGRARHTTSDLDITRRVWLPIDCDAARPAGISAKALASTSGSTRKLTRIRRSMTPRITGILMGGSHV
jgi:hypothetical protein